jgi:hypothetical protein
VFPLQATVQVDTQDYSTIISGKLFFSLCVDNQFQAVVRIASSPTEKTSGGANTGKS